MHARTLALTLVGGAVLLLPTLAHAQSRVEPLPFEALTGAYDRTAATLTTALAVPVNQYAWQADPTDPSCVNLWWWQYVGLVGKKSHYEQWCQRASGWRQMGWSGYAAESSPDGIDHLSDWYSLSVDGEPGQPYAPLVFGASPELISARVDLAFNGRPLTTFTHAIHWRPILSGDRRTIIAVEFEESYNYDAPWQPLCGFHAKVRHEPRRLFALGWQSYMYCSPTTDVQHNQKIVNARQWQY